MQIFSGVQRNIADQKTLTPFLVLAGLLLLYAPMTSLYPVLPPLLGVAYIRWREALYTGGYLEAGLWMLYTLLLEAVWGLPLYGTWTVMLVTFTLFDPKITYALHARALIGAISVVIFDGLYLLFLLGYGALMHSSFVAFDPVLLYYLLADLLGAFLL